MREQTILSRLVETFAVVKSSWDTVFLRNAPISDIEDQRVMGQPYKSSDLVYICISTTARAISQIPLIVCQGVGDEAVPVSPDSPWQKLFTNPNPYLDRYSFVEAIISYIMLEGGVFIIPFPPSIKVIPDTIWVTNYKFVKPKRNPQTNQLESWRYTPSMSISIDSNKGIDLFPEEICHIWLWNPYDLILGMAPIDAGKMTIQTDYKAAWYNANFFDEGASASGVLSTEQKINDKQYLRMEKQMEKHKGYQRSQRLMILEGGLKFTQTSLKHRDMEYLKLRQFNQQRILQIFGMKKAIISVTDDLNYATHKGQERVWWQSTNLPLMKMVESAINFCFLERYGLSVKFDLSKVEALQEVIADKIETAKDLNAMGFTANEINERLGLGFKERPWRNVWWKPFSLESVDDNFSSAPDDLTPDEPGVEPPIEETFSTGKGIDGEKAWKNLIAQITPIEKKFTSKVRKVFYEMRKKSLGHLFGSKSKDISDLLDETFDEEMRLLEKGAAGLYQESMLVGWDSFINEVGLDLRFDLSDPVVVEYLKTKLSKITGVGETIQTQINRSLSEGVDVGESIDQLAERIKSIFNVADKRAKTIARTEVVGSSNFGRYVGINESGFKVKEWFTALDERVRESHQEMHGQKIDVEDNWEMPSGASLRYPGDYSGPPEEIINCRCIEVVVLKD